MDFLQGIFIILITSLLGFGSCFDLYSTAKYVFRNDDIKPGKSKHAVSEQWLEEIKEKKKKVDHKGKLLETVHEEPSEELEKTGRRKREAPSYEPKTPPPPQSPKVKPQIVPKLSEKPIEDELIEKPGRRKSEPKPPPPPQSPKVKPQIVTKPSKEPFEKTGRLKKVSPEKIKGIEREEQIKEAPPSALPKPPQPESAKVKPQVVTKSTSLVLYRRGSVVVHQPEPRPEFPSRVPKKIQEINEQEQPEKGSTITQRKSMLLKESTLPRPSIAKNMRAQLKAITYQKKHD